MVLDQMLATWGVRVTSAGSGVEARGAVAQATATAEPFALVLLDRDLGGGDGFALAASLGVRTILLATATGGSGDLADAPALGVAAQVMKPVRRGALLDALTTAFRPESPLQARVEPAATPATPEGRALRVLLAEDYEDNRQLIQYYLEATSCVVDVAEDGAQAIERFAAGDYDIVLMDVQMPVLDGNSATRAIRAWERDHARPPTPILALTANAFADDVKESLAAGCTAHLNKPISKSSLLAAIAGYSRAADEIRP